MSGTWHAEDGAGYRHKPRGELAHASNWQGTKVAEQVRHAARQRWRSILHNMRGGGAGQHAAWFKEGGAGTGQAHGMTEMAQISTEHQAGGKSQHAVPRR